jgi:hypothetical protein
MDIPHVFAVDANGTIVQDWAQTLLNGPSFSADVDKLVARGAAANAAPAATPAKGKKK